MGSAALTYFSLQLQVLEMLVQAQLEMLVQAHLEMQVELAVQAQVQAAPSVGRMRSRQSANGRPDARW